ncbi:MAG: hypothetical protein AB2541_02465 [Candidatus Thiodiazotropha sp.]
MPNFAKSLFCLILFVLGLMATGTGFGRGVRTRGGRGRSVNSHPRYCRSDSNIFAVLHEPKEYAQDGDGPGGHDIFENSASVVDMDMDFEDGFTVARSKQSKRQRVSSSGQSGSAEHSQNIFEDDIHDYETLSNDEKLSLILSKLSVNENRVKLIQGRIDDVVNVKKRISDVENVVRSHAERLKLLEYRSIDIEARGRRRNLLFKGLAENRRENCFEVIRNFVYQKLKIDKDMYLERAHRLGQYNASKTRPIIVAFRDFCDTEYILSESKNLKGTDFGISRDYPNEISRARQSLWKQFKSTRDNNPNKRVTFGYPANISIDGVTVVDLFPDWYDILQGSRISSLSNQPKQLVRPRDPLASNSETGLFGSGNNNSFSLGDKGERDQNIVVSAELHTTRKLSPSASLIEPGQGESIYKCDIQASEQLSPSMLSTQAPEAAMDSAVSNRTLTNQITKAVPVRGRSINRRDPTDDRRRSQSTLSRPRRSQSRNKSKACGSLQGNPSDKGPPKSTCARSKSRARGPSAPPDRNINSKVNDNTQNGFSSQANTV